jgi:hypothetical protein
MPALGFGTLIPDAAVTITATQAEAESSGEDRRSGFHSTTRMNMAAKSQLERPDGAMRQCSEI